MNLRFMRNFLALCCPLFIRLYTFRWMYNFIYSTQYLQEINCFAQFTNIFDRVTSRVAFILKLIWLVIIFYTIETFMFSVSPYLLNDMGFFNIYLTFLLFVYYHNCKEKTIISYIYYIIDTNILLWAQSLLCNQKKLWWLSFVEFEFVGSSHPRISIPTNW